MIASLPMYDRPENAAAHDALWALVRAELGYGPAALDRETDNVGGWGRPDLLLGQICNLPYRAQFRDRVTRIGAAVYDLSDTPAGYYHSVFVTRAVDAPRGLAPAVLGRFAYNDPLSHSGWGAAVAEITQRGLQFHTKFQTGSHRASMLAVAEGRADLASIDAVTWRMFEHWEPAATGLRVIARTRLAPGMTFITAPTNDPAALYDALEAAIAALPAEHADTLGLRGITRLPDAAYDIPLPPAP